MIEKIGSSQEMSITLATPPLIAPQHHHLGADGYCSLASASASASTKMKKFIKYMECLKNHAAAIGGSATDGCGEFMAGGEAGSLEALKCEACNCHRNFHRKIIHMQQPQPEQGGGGGVVKSNISGEGRSKRLRSKFSQEQKGKMQRFAEKAGWKIPKADDAELRSFCQEIGVNRKVLKVWMHNNKYNHLPANC